MSALREEIKTEESEHLTIMETFFEYQLKPAFKRDNKDRMERISKRQ